MFGQNLAPPQRLLLPLHPLFDAILDGILHLSAVLQRRLQHSLLVNSLLKELLLVSLQPEDLGQQGGLELLLELVKDLRQPLAIDKVLLAHLLKVGPVCSWLSPINLARMAYDLTSGCDSRPHTAVIDIDGSQSDALCVGACWRVLACVGVCWC